MNTHLADVELRKKLVAYKQIADDQTQGLDEIISFIAVQQAAHTVEVLKRLKLSIAPPESPELDNEDTFIGAGIRNRNGMKAIFQEKIDAAIAAERKKT